MKGRHRRADWGEEHLPEAASLQLWGEVSDREDDWEDDVSQEKWAALTAPAL